MAIDFTEAIVSNPEGVQGSYPLNLAIGHEGMLADLQAYVSRSFSNESGAVIPFGHLVSFDAAATTGLGVKVVAGATDLTVMGIAIDSFVFEGSTQSSYKANATPPGVTLTDDGRLGYADKQMVNVCSKGVVLVKVVDAVAIGDPVRYLHTDLGTAADDGGYAGRFLTAAVAGSSAEITAGARWLSAAGAGELALLEIDIPTIAITADA